MEIPPGHRSAELPGEETSEDLPTLPPASRATVAGLRWATSPLKRPSGQGQVGPNSGPNRRPNQVGPNRAGPNRAGPDRAGPEPGSAPYETGPPTVVMPAVLSGPLLPPVSAMTVENGTPEGEAEVDAQRPRRRRVWLLLSVLALIVAVAAGALLLGGLGGFGGASPRRTAAGTLTPQAIFEGFLADSAQAHQLLGEAVSEACQPAPPATATREGLLVEVSRAETMRRSVLDGVATDRRRLLAMNGGPSLVSDLDHATSASLLADQGYEAWLEDLQATGCYGAPTNDIHYRAASEASLAASVAKERVVAIWAGVASRYGLPSWTAGQL